MPDLPFFYKTVAFTRWDQGVRSLDAFWCVPWPRPGELEFAILTAALASEDGTPPSEEQALRDHGFVEARNAMNGIATEQNLRARFNDIQGPYIFNTEGPLTDEEALTLIKEKDHGTST